MSPLALELTENESKSANYQILSKKTVETNDPFNYNQLLETLSHLESKLELFRTSTYNPHWSEVRGVEDVLQKSSLIDLNQETMENLKKPFEILRLGHFEPFSSPLAEDLPKEAIPYFPNRKNWFFFNLLTTIEYAKTFPFFAKLATRDQLLLTRHVALSCANLHVSNFSVSKSSDDIIQPDGSPEPVRDKVHYPVKTMAIAPLIRYKIGHDEYVLLKAMCFCNPAVPNLSLHAQNIISIQRKQLAAALFHRSLFEHGKTGPARFVELLGVLNLLESQQKRQRDLFILAVKPISVKFTGNDRIQLVEEVMDYC